MSWALLLGLVVGLGFAFAVTRERRANLRRMQDTVQRRDRAKAAGASEAQLQHPVVDLSRCLGCATCVAVCPEDGVLELVHGQAMVVNGARCVGVSACERECPVGAITVTLSNVNTRDDIPVVSESLEAVGSPGLYLAGEVTAHALIKVAIDHGTAVARAVGARVGTPHPAAGPSRAAAEPVRTAVDAKPSFRAESMQAGTSHVADGADAAPAGDGTAAEASRERTMLALAEGDREATGEEGGAAAIADRRARDRDRLYDLLIVGAGPAGLACALEAKRLGLDFVVIDQEATIGGTVSKYPRHKLVMTQPVDLPLFGRMKTTYTKEELIAQWAAIADEQSLPIDHGRIFGGLARDEADGESRFTVQTDGPTYRAKNVCLAIGRRGVPRRLEVPGEESSKVAYSLMDANSYQGRRILVVGGGDSAVEAALGLAEQPGNDVTLAYRRESLFRIRQKNEDKLAARVEQPGLTLRYRTELRSIEPERVVLSETSEHGERTTTVLDNDDVFIMAGGVPPFELMASAGVSFDPKLREQVDPIRERGTGLAKALGIGLLIAVATLVFALLHYDYYGLPNTDRPTHDKHGWLRPGDGLGLWLGFISVALIVANLAYLLRRAPRIPFRWGSLERWMTSHVATGIFALLCAMLHGAMAPGDTPGGHAFWALAFLLVTGAVGRYFYSWVPRAANGRELELAEVKARFDRLSDAWDQGQRQFRARVRDAVLELVEQRQWGGSFRRRAVAIVRGQREITRLIKRLTAEARAEGIAEDQIRDTIQIARRVYGAAVMVRRYEDLRAVLATWRYFHRWIAALMILLVTLHIFHAVFYGNVLGGGAR